MDPGATQQCGGWKQVLSVFDCALVDAERNDGTRTCLPLLLPNEVCVSFSVEDDSNDHTNDGKTEEAKTYANCHCSTVILFRSLLGRRSWNYTGGLYDKFRRYVSTNMVVVARQLLPEG